MCCAARGTQRLCGVVRGCRLHVDYDAMSRNGLRVFKKEKKRTFLLHMRSTDANGEFIGATENISQQQKTVFALSSSTSVWIWSNVRQLPLVKQYNCKSLPLSCMAYNSSVGSWVLGYELPKGQVKCCFWKCTPADKGWYLTLHKTVLTVCQSRVL